VSAFLQGDGPATDGELGRIGAKLHPAGALAEQRARNVSIEGNTMLHYAIVFFVIALVAALFGFTGLAVGAAGIAKILFFVFLIGAIISLLINLTRRA
jgi:uncharacterized membrane protein YtjA (UPF0391 family)